MQFEKVALVEFNTGRERKRITPGVSVQQAPTSAVTPMSSKNLGVSAIVSVSSASQGARRDS